MPAGVSVGKLVASGTLTDPESHAHFPLVDVVAVALNVAMTVKVVHLPDLHVIRSVDGSWRAALGAVEGEVPTAAAVVTSI